MIRRLSLAILLLAGVLTYLLLRAPQPNAAETSAATAPPSHPGGVARAAAGDLQIERATAPALPPSAEASPSSGLLLRIFQADGTPARGARLATLDLSPPHPRMVGYYEADARGEIPVLDWHMESAATHACVLAHANHAPTYFRAAPVAGVHDVRLLQDLALEGVVRVGGQAPGVAGVVSVTGYRDPAQELPAPAREILAQWGLGAGATQFTFGADGRFALRGVPAGELVELTFPDGYRLRDDPERAHPARLRVQTPALGMVMDLEPLPAMRGTLLRAAEAPLVSTAPDGSLRVVAFPNLALGLEWTLISGEAQETGSVPVASGHEFRIPLTRPHADRIQLRVRDANARLIGWREVQGPFAGDVDLGEWTVPDAQRAMLLTVLDVGGRPVADALVVAHGVVQGRTGADGCLRLEFHAPVGTLTVGAFGHRLQRAVLPDPPPEQFTIRLEPASRLRLEVVEPDGAPATAVVAVLAFSGPLDPDGPEMVAGFHSARGPAAGGGIWSNDWHEHHYPLLDGTAEWSDLPLDASFTLQVRDPYDVVLHEETLQLAAAEFRLVRVTTPRAARELAGRVVGPDGTPIEGASVLLGGMFREARTDAAGAFRFFGSYADAPELWISAEGWVSRSIPAAEWAPDRTWSLEAARTVWVEMRDARGERADAGLGPMIETDGGWRGTGVQRGVGLYEVNGVPRRPGRVTVPKTELEPTPIGADQTQVLLLVP